MKNAVMFIIIFGLGALCYALLMQFFTPQGPTENENIDRSPTSTSTVTEMTPDTEAQEEKEIERPVVVTADGSLLDGPFVIFDKDGNEVGATVRILRSPEETLLQFEDWDEEYSFASRVYFAADIDATDYFNLGSAKMSDDVLVYGIPLDAKLESYSYVLIYDEERGVTEYYAKIR